MTLSQDEIERTVARAQKPSTMCFPWRKTLGNFLNCKATRNIFLGLSCSPSWYMGFVLQFGKALPRFWHLYESTILLPEACGAINYIPENLENKGWLTKTINKHWRSLHTVQPSDCPSVTMPVPCRNKTELWSWNQWWLKPTSFV